MTNATRSANILLVEDNKDDVVLTREALKEWRMDNSMYHVKDGVEAMAFLRREGGFSSSPSPDIVFLDLNLPGKDGRQVLAEIKEDASLKHIPVIILTTSEAEEDIMRAYSLHANCYITKPVDLNRFFAVIKAVEDFWFGVVKIPNGRNKKN